MRVPSGLLSGSSWRSWEGAGPRALRVRFVLAHPKAGCSSLSWAVPSRLTLTLGDSQPAVVCEESSAQVWRACVQRFGAWEWEHSRGEQAHLWLGHALGCAGGGSAPRKGLLSLGIQQAPPWGTVWCVGTRLSVPWGRAALGRGPPTGGGRWPGEGHVLDLILRTPPSWGRTSQQDCVLRSRSGALVFTLF